MIEIADVVIMIAGFALLGIWVLQTWNRRRRAEPKAMLHPPLDPPVELVILPMLVFIMTATVFQFIVGALIESPAGDGENEVLPPRGLILVTNLSMLFGAVAAYVASRFSVENLRSSILLGGRTVAHHVLSAIGGVLIAFAVCQTVFVVTITAIGWLAPEFDFPEHTALDALRDGTVPPWLPVVVWIGTAMIAPVAEELFFRGLVQGYLIHRMGRWTGIGVTAVLFGLAHASQPQVVPALAVFGLILGILALRTGGLLAPIVAHALFNSRTMLWESF